MFHESSTTEDSSAETATKTSRNPYAVVYSIPGAKNFSISGAFARFPMSMVGIGIILMIEVLYNSYALGGKVSAAYVIAQAICSPQIAKLVDRYGQARIMRPFIVVSSLSLSALILAALTHQAHWMLYLFAILTGATIGAVGAMVRARWSHVVNNPRDLHTAYSLESAIDEMIFVIGPIAATVLATSVSPWAGLVVPVVLMVFGGFWFLAQKDTEPPIIAPVLGEKVPTVLRNPAVLAVIAVFICTGVIFGAADVATIAFAEEQGNKGLSGLVLGVFALGSCISGLLYGARQWGSALWKRFVVGIVALGVMVCLFFVATNLWMLAATMFLAGFAISPTLINGNNVIQLVVSPRQLTEGLTWVGTALGVGVSLGSSVAGVRIDEAGAHSGFSVVVIAGLVQVVIALVAMRTFRTRTTTHQIQEVPTVDLLDDESAVQEATALSSTIAPASTIAATDVATDLINKKYKK
ncbi:MFS transporter [Populibacterium corticicola]|uniref:MFS transporter n=1 Tax=Populibacterium corticicola TaxID=1812826 RepID=A0ABW5XEN3_9MICO